MAAQNKTAEPVESSAVKSGAAVGSRTPNLLIRSQMLYPIELQPHERAVNKRGLAGYFKQIFFGKITPLARPAGRAHSSHFIRASRTFLTTTMITTTRITEATIIV